MLMLRRSIDLAAYVVVRLAVAFLQALPEDRADRLCRFLAWCISDVARVRGATVDDNLRRVMPDAPPQTIAAVRRAMWRHLLLMVCEIAWAPRRLHRCNLHDHVKFTDAPEMLRHCLSRRPTVLVTGHFGNFEMGGYITGLLGIPTTTIARNLDNRYLHRYVTEFRGAKGQRMVDKDGCAPEIDRHLAEGGTLSLLADQHAGDRGCWVDFLGHPASCHKALALFTLTADAPMVVAYTRRGHAPMQFELGCTGVADPRRGTEETAGVRPLTAWYNDRLAAAIRLSPEQYWWVHRRWRPQPSRPASKAGRRAA